MNMQAFGGYIKGLRERQNLTQLDVVLALKPHLGRNVSTATISKIENAKAKTIGSDILLALLDVLNGNVRDAWELMRRGDATAEEGEARGRGNVAAKPRPVVSVLTAAEAEEFIRLAAAAGPEQRARAATELRRRLQED